jgi:hypothetical protein
MRATSDAHRLVADVLANILVFKKNFVSQENHVHRFRGLREVRLVLQITPQRDQPHESVEGAALEVVEAERLGHPLCDRAFAGGRRTIDRDDRDCHESGTDHVSLARCAQGGPW